MWSIICLTLLCSTKAAPSTYRAASIEFAPNQEVEGASHDEIRARKLHNVQLLAAFAERARANGSQIIVFPEYGITGDGYAGETTGNGDFTRSTVYPFLEELPSNVTNPCTEGLHSSPAIVAVSCLARQLKVVLVFNLLTRKPCTSGAAGCPKDGMRIHNTAIAVGEDGGVLAVYHKRHAYADEHDYIDPSTTHAPVTFTTSFGVRFAMLICFDLVFDFFPDTDALDFVFPTDWVNKRIPYPSARFAQQVWSGVHGRNLIAANYGGFGRDSSGSGIWSKGRDLASFFNPTHEPRSKLLVADVPRLRQAEAAIFV